jgi:hypothetical protein
MPSHAAPPTTRAGGAPERGVLAVTFAGRSRSLAVERAIAERFDRFAGDHAGLGVCRVAVEAASDDPSAPCFLRIGVVVRGEAFMVVERATLDGRAAAVGAAERAFVELARRIVNRGGQRGPASES